MARPAQPSRFTQRMNDERGRRTSSSGRVLGGPVDRDARAREEVGLRHEPAPRDERPVPLVDGLRVDPLRGFELDADAAAVLVRAAREGRGVRAGGLVQEDRPGVGRRAGDLRLDDAGAERLEASRPLVDGVAPLRLPSVADARRAAQEPDDETVEPRLGDRAAGEHRPEPAASPTVRAIGPTVSNDGQSG